MHRFRIALATGGVLAAIAATPAHAACSGTGAMPSGSNATKIRNATLCLLNAQRRAHGLQKLRANGRLRHAAAPYARLMVSRGFFSHDGPDGSTPQSRIQSTHYLDGARVWSIGENIAWGTGSLATPRSIVRSWMNSPGHRANILNPGFRDIGIGIANGAPVPLRGAARGATYATDFGSRG
jgi:uncharacterized protein YkwD